MGWGAILGAFWSCIKWAWPTIRTFAVYLGIMGAHVVIVRDLWQSAFAKIDSMVTGYSAQTINFSPLSLINSLFPLSEGLTMLTAYATIAGISAGVRITKAFIDSKKT